MGRKERQRYDYREQVFELVNSGRRLTTEEVSFIKEKFSGIGGLTPSTWDRGQFFTPPNVVKFVHDLIGYHDSPGPLLEPSCGGGAFFETLPGHLCHGIEFCRNTFAVAHVCYPDATIYNVAAEEMFPYDRPSQLDGQFQYVIGNPPFGEKIDWGGDISGGKLRKLPSEAVFMEIAWRAVRRGGRIALLVPEGLLNSANMQSVRKWLMERCFVRCVISLPPETFYFSGTSCKTSILCLDRFPEGVTAETVGNYSIFMAICKDIGWDSRGRMSHNSDLPIILEEWRKSATMWEASIEWKASACPDISPGQEAPAPPAPVEACDSAAPAAVKRRSSRSIAVSGQLTMF